MPRPRKPGSGGPRTGAPGASYTNRSDLNSALPARAATGQAYGQAGQQLAAQRAVPLAPAGAAQQPGGGAPAQAAPGSAGPFDRPSDRPGEPITSGLPVGPGAGPEALGNLGQAPDDMDLQALAPYVGVLELAASQPGATVASRNFVRRLRGAIPPSAYQDRLG